MSDYITRLENALVSAICILQNAAGVAEVVGRDRTAENFRKWSEELIQESGIDFEAVLNREKQADVPSEKKWTLAQAVILLIGRWEQERDFERKMWLEAEINELGEALNRDTVERLRKSGDKNMVDHMRDTLERIAVEYPSAVEMCDCGDRPGYACPKCEIAFLLKEWTQTEDFRAGTD